VAEEIALLFRAHEYIEHHLDELKFPLKLYILYNGYSSNTSAGRTFCIHKINVLTPTKFQHMLYRVHNASTFCGRNTERLEFTK